MYQLPLTYDNDDVETLQVSEVGIDPIHSTFRGGRSELLHLWYPLLEGYSPQFVETIVNAFAPQACRILDPFGGTGTTPITVTQMGRQALYSEVNPLLQLLIEVKTLVYSLKPELRNHLREKLLHISDTWLQLLQSATADIELNKVFPVVFGNSKFFTDETYEMVLRARSVIDTLALDEPLATKVVMIAVLASLLPSSELVRSGDIRYRTAKEQAKKVSFGNEVVRRLRFMAEDIAKLEAPFESQPVFLCEDARNLSKLPFQNLDLVVTSPPYLNGTNYFRNAKMELWFLRVLKLKQDLATFRYRAVTSGINDVTVSKIGNDIPQAAAAIVRKLQENAYDVRIPKMAIGYFKDMKTIFGGITQHLQKGATVAVDLGDSVYSGVHIPTDEILVEILGELGLNLTKDIVLRKRTSRDQTELEQVLLVFRYGQEAKAALKITNSANYEAINWQKTWVEFKELLPHQKLPYAKRNWGNPLHSLCSYQGKMKPSLANQLVRIFAPKGGKMLDPFSGVGTIPFEASLEGVTAFGFDISPAAVAISSAKVGVCGSKECEKVISNLEKYLITQEPSSDEYATVQEMGFNGRIPEYFHASTLKEVLLARRYFLSNPPQTSAENLVFSSLLHILHGNRPYALSRNSHPITPYKPTGETEYREMIPRLREKVRKSLDTERSKHFIPGKIFDQDATKWWPSEVDELDAVITSPPFFDSTRFHMGNWMRLWFCGWEKHDFDEKPNAFIDELQKDSFKVYEPIFRQSRERLKRDGVLVMHLGLSHKSDMAKELAKIASQWFTIADIFVEDVTHLESHGIRDKGTVTGHQFLILT